MTVIAKFMKRLGWVKESEGGASARGHHGDQSWGFVPEAPVDAASYFDPSLAAPAKQSLPPLPRAQQLQPPLAQQLQPPQAQQLQPAQAQQLQPAQPQSASPAAWQAQLAQQVAPSASDDENAWLAAVAKAKSQANEQPAAVAASEEPEEDWEALMTAARQRAQADASPVAKVLAVARERAKSEPPVAPHVNPVFAVPTQPAPPVGPASFQVEQGAVAANDDRPAVQLNAVPGSQEEVEWQQLRSQVEAKERAENERKLRAIREIRRLRGNRGNTRNVPATSPPRSRLAAGTAGPPIQATGTPMPTERGQSLVMNPAPRARMATAKPPGVSTNRSIPRITQRLNKGS